MFGHEYGDLMLIEVAERIESCVREMDIVAHLGEAEFAVLIGALGKDHSEASHSVLLMANTLHKVLTAPYRIKGHEYYSTTSIGVRVYSAQETPAEIVMQQADMTMRHVKNTGGNAVCIFDPIMQHTVAVRSALENDLHRAIACQQLRLYYQVQVDHARRPLGAEVLLRWLHPQRGWVQPIQFIPIAEESLLILKIGQWALEQACQQLAHWANDAQKGHLVLAVNVSARQFTQAVFVDQVTEALKTHRIDPAHLKLELTESLLLHDAEGTIRKMHALKQLGIKLSMDDFGTGYSSLSYLKDLPLDQIKIDQHFVQGITHNNKDAMLVHTIINLAKNFGMDVIAEGVESEEQLAFLNAHHCMAYQGYLFGRPVPIEELEQLLDGLKSTVPEI
jgi:diguanylate cyclase (GGDEF)-like protein